MNMTALKRNIYDKVNWFPSIDAHREEKGRFFENFVCE